MTTFRGMQSRLLTLFLPIAILSVIPLLFPKATYYMNLLFLIFLYIAIAQSWNILGGIAGQVNLGQAALFGLGALTARLLWIGGVNPYIGILIGGVIATIFGLVIGFPTFRLRGIYFAIGTLALAEILRHVVQNAFPVVSLLPYSYIAEYDLLPRYYLALALAFVTTLTVFAIINSKMGLGMMAIREDEEAAKASGVNAFKHKLLALLISSSFAGLAGGLFAFYQVSYYYEYPFSPLWSFDPLIISFIGGVGAVTGPIIGAIFFVIFKEFFTRAFIEMHLLVFGALFIAVIVLLPGGIVELLSRARRIIASPRSARARNTS